MPVLYETAPPPRPPGDLGPYRAADYLDLPDEPRCELLYGRLVVMPSPTVRHQLVVGEVFRLLLDLAKNEGSRAIVSPIDVVLADHSIVQPDVVFVSKVRSPILHARVEGAPDLVVEVLSPGTARRDLGEKLRLYAESGIVEYWIVDPVLATFEFLVNSGDGFRVRLAEGGTYRSETVLGLELDLEAFWKAIPD